MTDKDLRRLIRESCNEARKKQAIAIVKNTKGWAL